MFSKLRRSFQRGEELSRFQSEERHRSYLNVREFLDDLDLRSNVSTAQSEVIGKNKAKKKSRKHNFLSIFNNEDNSIKNGHGSRSVSMVSSYSYSHMSHHNKSNWTPTCGLVNGIPNHNYFFWVFSKHSINISRSVLNICITWITHIHIITHNKDTCIQNDILDIYIVFLFDGFVTGTRYTDN